MRTDLPPLKLPPEPSEEPAAEALAARRAYGEKHRCPGCGGPLRVLSLMEDVCTLCRSVYDFNGFVRIEPEPAARRKL